MSAPLITITRLVVLLFVGFMAAIYALISVRKLSDKKPKPMMSENNRAVFWLSVAGPPVFLLGLALVFLPVFGHLDLGLALIVTGFLAGCASTFLNAALAKSKRATWPVVPARCTRRQLLMKKFSGESGSSDGWLWQVTCEIDYAGKHCIVSPKIHWSDFGQADAPFWSEEKKQLFLPQKISSDGECKLRVNPNNPTETELL